MPMIPSDLNALLGSRICHDLISPIGAIGNGVELLQMAGVEAGPELALITESVANANARIRLFRVAFGAAMDGQSVSGAEIRAILAPFQNSKDIRIDWTPAGSVPRAQARLILLLILCAETMLPWGGDVRVIGGTEALSVRMSAERMRVEPMHMAQLQDHDLEMPSASEVHFALARTAASEMGRELRVETNGAVTITLR